MKIISCTFAILLSYQVAKIYVINIRHEFSFISIINLL